MGSALHTSIVASTRRYMKVTTDSQTISGGRKNTRVSTRRNSAMSGSGRRQAREFLNGFHLLGYESRL